MSEGRDVDLLESEVYRSRFDDGSIEVFLGVSLIWIGVAWVYLPDFAGLAGVLPAVFVAPFVAWRSRFLERRLGYVRFGPARRSRERSGLVIAVAAGIAIFALGVGVYMALSAGSSLPELVEAIMPGLIAFLLAGLVLGLAMITGAWRLLVVATVLVVGGIMAAVYDANPGAPLIPAGLVATVWGTVRLINFIHLHPVVEPR